MLFDEVPALHLFSLWPKSYVLHAVPGVVPRMPVFGISSIGRGSNVEMAAQYSRPAAQTLPRCPISLQQPGVSAPTYEACPWMLFPRH